MKTTSLERAIAQNIGYATGSDAPVMSRKFIEEYQLEMLNQQIKYCLEYSPFYRQKLVDVHPQTVLTGDDVAKLPLTSEEEMRSHGSGMVCVSQDEVARIMTMHSSGTTGQPKRLFFTEEDLQRTLEFFHKGMQELVTPGQKLAILLPGSSPDSTGHLLGRAMDKMNVESYILGLVDDPEKTAHQLSTIEPDSLVGFPIQLLAIGRVAQALDISLAPIRSLLLCSDYIPKGLSRQLTCLPGFENCEVFSHYGTVETGLGGGVDCRAHLGTHLREDELFFEIIDPKSREPLPDGEWGEIVFSTLKRKGMALLRYRTGDTGRLLPGTCPCGSNIKRLDRVLGRRNQIKSLKNGQQLALRDLDDILFDIKGLIDFSACLISGEQEAHQEQLLLKITTIKTQEKNVSEEILKSKTLQDLQQKLELKLVPSISWTSTIHPGKRTLGDKREGDKQ